MNKLIVLLLATTIFLLSCREGLMYVCYKLNQESITDIFCINKETKTSCKGRCFITDQISDSQESDTGHHQFIDQQLQKTFYLTGGLEAILSPGSVSGEGNFTFLSHYQLLLISRLLRPPAFLRAL